MSIESFVELLLYKYSHKRHIFNSINDTCDCGITRTELIDNPSPCYFFTKRNHIDTGGKI